MKYTLLILFIFIGHLSIGQVKQPYVKVSNYGNAFRRVAASDALIPPTFASEPANITDMLGDSTRAGIFINTTTKNLEWYVDGNWYESSFTGAAGTVTDITARYPLTGGTITTSGSVGMAQVSDSGNFGDATHYPKIHVDAYGRIIGVTLQEVSATGVDSLVALTDVNITSALNNQLLKYNSSTHKWVNFTPSYLTAETDPVFGASPAGSISNTMITHWNSAYDSYPTSLGFNTGTGVFTLTKRDGSTLTQNFDGRYLTSFTETDPFSFHKSDSNATSGAVTWSYWNNNVGNATNLQNVTIKGNTTNRFLQTGAITGITPYANYLGYSSDSAGALYLQDNQTVANYIYAGNTGGYKQLQVIHGNNISRFLSGGSGYSIMELADSVQELTFETLGVLGQVNYRYQLNIPHGGTTYIKFELPDTTAGIIRADTIPACGGKYVTWLNMIGGYNSYNFPVATKKQIDSIAAIVIAGLLPSLNNGKFWVGDGTNTATAVGPSGDVTFNNTGIFAIGANKVVTSMINSNAVTLSKMDATNSNAYRPLVSQSSASPIWLGYALPSSVGSAGKMVYSDGSNWVMSTPTLPITSSPTAGYIMMGDGTNWTAVPPTQQTTASNYSTSTTITSSDIRPIEWIITAQSGALLFNNPTGTFKELHSLVIRMYTGSTQNLTWGSQFRDGSSTLPTVTTAGKELYMEFLRNTNISSTHWDLVGLSYN